MFRIENKLDNISDTLDWLGFSAEENQKKFPEESEQRSSMKPLFSSVIKDVEVVEGSAARFDCKIEGMSIQTPAHH